MSIGKSLAKVLLFAFLNLGALSGVPMDPEKIRQLMEMANRTRVEQVMKKEDPP